MDYVMGNPLYSILVMVILAPVLEEYIFRKLLIDRLSKYGELTAMLFSATVFGLFHMNFFQFFYAFGLGLLFAYIYTRTRNLLYPVLLHMIINFQGSVLAPWLLSSVDLELITALESGAAATEDIRGYPPRTSGIYALLQCAAGRCNCRTCTADCQLEETADSSRWPRASLSASLQGCLYKLGHGAVYALLPGHDCIGSVLRTAEKANRKSGSPVLRAAENLIQIHHHGNGISVQRIVAIEEIFAASALFAVIQQNKGSG